MNVPPKAPPIYKPTPPRLAAPPVYRPNQFSAPSAQLKAASNFKLETRSAPPVYRPQQADNPGAQLKPAKKFGVEMRPAPPVYEPQQAIKSGLQPKLKESSRSNSSPARNVRMSMSLTATVQMMKRKAKEEDKPGSKTAKVSEAPAAISNVFSDPTLMHGILSFLEPPDQASVALVNVAAYKSYKAVVKSSLSDKAKVVWNQLNTSGRGMDSTTVAFSKCTDGKLYCTANDVNGSSVGEATREEAALQGAAQGVDLASAGFHAEMWAIHLAGDDPAGTISSIGASRPCCFHCTKVLGIYGISAEQPGAIKFKGWVNPMTTGADSQPKGDFASHQRKDLPDFRQNSVDYWWTSKSGAWTKTPAGA